MKFRTLVYRSLTFYRRTHMGVLLGTVIGTGILTGALIVGDSVRYSLKRLSLMRLGKTEFALSSGDRYFRTKLADELAVSLNVPCAPVLKLDGMASSEGGRKRANRVKVLGVDRQFWSMGQVTSLPDAGSPDQAVINRYLAERLNLRQGDEFLLRIQRASLLPGDVPLTSANDRSVALRLTVRDIASDEQFGRFDLRINQVAPQTVFLPLDVLNQRMEFEDRANVLLVSTDDEYKLTLQRVNHALGNTWRLSDAGLRIRELPHQTGYELISDRIFLETPVVEAAAQETDSPKQVLTYLVNTIRHGTAQIPYSFVSAPGSPLVPEAMTDNDIILNRWAAQDISASVGDLLYITYYIPDAGHRLIEKTTGFRVYSIVPIRGPAADQSLTPLFPGLSDAENCRDWDPGIPIDLDRIRDKDEAYWNRYRGTPKAYLTLDAAQKFWANRFGSLTALRYTGSIQSPSELEKNILSRLQPASLGLVFRPVRQEALRAGSDSIDFGQLLIGLSFFIIVAALLLTGLLFVLTVEQRSEEMGSLLALGYRPKQVRRLLLTEGTIIALVGSLIGAGAGILFNQAILTLLGTVWRGAVGTSSLVWHIKPVTLLTGFCTGALLSVMAMGVATRRQTQKTIRDLQRPSIRYTRAKRFISLILACVCFLGVIVIMCLANPGKDRAAANAFWGAGSLMLLGSISLSHGFLIRVRNISHQTKMRLTSLGSRNMARRVGRSTATVALLALGSFIVIGVGANRQSTQKNADRRDAGTGGFALYGETTLPVLQDLNTHGIQRQLGLIDENVLDCRFVSLRMREGDDASCLNLNRIQKPRILGIRPEELAQRGAFSFARVEEGLTRDNPWLLLNQELGDNIIPAIADQTVIVWGLGKTVGDTLTYIDERGDQLHLKLVGSLTNSIFQGSVITAEQFFNAHFPSISGSRVFLIDTPPETRRTVMDVLSRTMQDYGLELTAAPDRLAAFNTVTNTYLSIFLALGGLGLILGTGGIGIIVIRNAMERRSEMALLKAVGFSIRSIQKMVLSENIVLLILGMVCGTVSAIIAVLPALLSPGTEIPYLFLLTMLIAILLSGFCWTLVATKWATRGDLIPSLRNE